MSWFEFDWVDAFTNRAFGGNGCAVVHGGAGLSAEVCEKLKRVQPRTLGQAGRIPGVTPAAIAILSVLLRR